MYTFVMKVECLDWSIDVQILQGCEFIICLPTIRLPKLTRPNVLLNLEIVKINYNLKKRKLMNTTYVPFELLMLAETQELFLLSCYFMLSSVELSLTNKILFLKTTIEITFTAIE